MEASVAWMMHIGAQPGSAGTRFRVWADTARRVEVVVYEGDRATAAHELLREGDGYFSAHVAGVGPGAHYKYRLDGDGTFPDPASRFQPEGVHGPSEVIDPAAF